MISTAISSVLHRWANLPPVVRVLLLALVAAVAGLVAVKPAYGVFRDWRMKQNLKSAHEALEQARMADARDYSLSVLRSGDPCIEAIRILEKSTGALLDPRHGEIARALIAHPEGTTEDRLTGFLGVVMEVPMGLVGQAWNALGAASQKDPRAASAFARRLIAERRFGEAKAVLREVPAAQRDGAVLRLLVQALIGTGRWDDGEEAQGLIAGGFPADGAELAAWLDLLEEIPARSLEDRLLDPIRGRLEELAAGRDVRCALMIARMDYATRFTRRKEVVDGVIAGWKDSDPVAVARFLKSVGLHEMMMKALPEGLIGEHPELLPILLEAAERGGAWDRAAALLDGHGGTLPKLDELAHRAVVAANATADGARIETWNAAMAEAAHTPGAGGFLALHRLATAAAMPAEAEKAKVAALRTGRGPLPLFENLGPLLFSLEQQGRENTLIEICAIYLAFEPGNPSVIIQYAYLACMNGLAEPETIIKAITPLAAAYPEQLPIQAVLAAVYLCDGQAAKAAEILDSLNLDLTKLAPVYRAMYLTTQVLNSRMSATDPKIKEFPWQTLPPAQRKKFSDLIRSAER